MELRSLGSTGVRVSRYALGTMALGALGNHDRDDCLRLIHAALDAGINSIDTADVYSHGEAEELVGQAVAGRRDRVIVATKCYWPMGPDANQRGSSRRWVLAAVEGSLRRLGTDWVDVVYLHKPDPLTDVAESLRALDDLIHQGKIRMWGTSSFPAELLVEAREVAAARSLTRSAVEQPAYSILARGCETAILPVCQASGTGVMIFGPLNGGWLTGKYQPGQPDDPSSRAHRWPRDGTMRQEGATARRKTELITQLQEVAAAAGCSLTGLALRFVTEHPAVTSAILGPRTIAQLHDLLAAGEGRLDAETLDRIDGIVAPGTDVDASDRWYRSEGLDAGRRRRR